MCPRDHATALRRAVFLDRDGVLVEDRGLLLKGEDICVLPGVPEALRRLHLAGFALVVVSNQAVVARGLLREDEVVMLQREIEAQLWKQGAPVLDGFYFCPHHPKAHLEAYRKNCSCRKPRAGLLQEAAQNLGLDLSTSFMVGDRPTDLQAGKLVGCRTIWVQTGRHGDEPIETTEPLDEEISAAFQCSSLAEAATWIMEIA